MHQERPELWEWDDWQFHHNNAATHLLHLTQIFWPNTVSISAAGALFSRHVSLWLWLFPKLKTHTVQYLKTRKRSNQHDKPPVNDSQRRLWKIIWQLKDGWNKCVKSEGAYFEGDWGSSSKVLQVFSQPQVRYFLTRPIISMPSCKNACEHETSW